MNVNVKVRGLRVRKPKLFEIEFDVSGSHLSQSFTEVATRHHSLIDSVIKRYLDTVDDRCKEVSQGDSPLELLHIREAFVSYLCGWIIGMVSLFIEVVSYRQRNVRYSFGQVA